MVVGAGRLGLMLCMLAHLQGARVILVGKGEERLRTAKEFGVNDTVDMLDRAAAGDRIQAVKELTQERRGADVVIEAVGKPEAWEEALQMGRKASKVVLFGGCSRGTSIAVDTHRLHYEELTLYGVFHQTPDDYKRAGDLLASRLVDGRQFVKETLPLNQLIDAFHRVKALEAIKYAIDPTVMS